MNQSWYVTPKSSPAPAAARHLVLASCWVLVLVDAQWQLSLQTTCRFGEQLQCQVPGGGSSQVGLCAGSSARQQPNRTHSQGALACGGVCEPLLCLRRRPGARCHFHERCHVRTHAGAHGHAMCASGCAQDQSYRDGKHKRPPEPPPSLIVPTSRRTRLTRCPRAAAARNSFKLRDGTPLTQRATLLASVHV